MCWASCGTVRAANREASWTLTLSRLGQLHLHPISETHQLRPTLTYMDVLSRKNRRGRGGAGSDDDSDDFELPSPTRIDQSLPSTPPPYSESVWGNSYVDAQPHADNMGKGSRAQCQVETTLSPTAGPSLPFLLIRGEASQFAHAAHEFPSSIEHDEIFSPLSPVRASPFVHDWLQGPGAIMV